MEYGFNISELYDALMEEHKRRERQHYLEQKKKILEEASKDITIAQDMLDNNWISQEEFEEIIKKLENGPVDVI